MYVIRFTPHTIIFSSLKYSYYATLAIDMTLFICFITLILNFKRNEDKIKVLSCEVSCDIFKFHMTHVRIKLVAAEKR